MNEKIFDSVDFPQLLSNLHLYDTLLNIEAKQPTFSANRIEQAKIYVEQMID